LPRSISRRKDSGSRSTAPLIHNLSARWR
jgi:hypothetical protein